MLTLGLLVCFSSCSSIEPDPDVTLSHALETLGAQSSFAFSGTEEVKIDGITVQKRNSVQGAVAEQNRMYIQTDSGRGTVYNRSNEAWLPATAELGSINGLFANWNPLEKMEQLQALDKQVQVNRELSLVDNLVLDAEIDSGKVTEMVRKSIKNSLEGLTSDRLEEFIQAEHLSESDASRLRAELTESTRDSVSKLLEMSDNLAVRMNYRIWVERESSLPQRMSVQMLFNYKYENRDSEEAIAADYEFRDFDKPVMIPPQ
jgi:hypothetical protein